MFSLPAGGCDFYRIVPLLVVSVLVISVQSDETCTKENASKSAPMRLKKDLFCDYDKAVRPVQNHNNATAVTVRMILKFLEYNDRSNTMSIHNWMAMYWTDEHLRWTPSDYDGTTKLHVDSDDLWVPDLAVYNSGDLSTVQTSISSTKCIVYYSGSVICIPPSRHDALCVPDYKYWPYDQQECTVRYGSWIHTGEELSIGFAKNPISFDDYQQNNEWDVVTVKTVKNGGNYSGIPDQTFPTLEFVFQLKRHSQAYATVLMVPCFVFAMMTVLTVCFRPDSVERVYLAGINLFCHFLFLQFLSWEVPPNGNTSPLVLLFFRDSLMLASCTLILTVIVKSIMGLTSSTPHWLASLNSSLLNSKLGQVVLLSNTDPKSAAVVMNNGIDDGNDLVTTNSGESRPRDWLLFAKFVDKIALVLIVFLYFITFLFYVPM